MHSKVSKQSGFTLVEIAIVLVIIGLLLGGVLKGQEMITSAKVKNLAGDQDGVVAAFNSYQDRFKALPGDDANVEALGRFGVADCGGVACVAAQPAATLGNGTINGAFNSIIDTNESRVLWQQLRAAGFLKKEGGSMFVPPLNAMGTATGVDGAGRYGWVGGTLTHNMVNIPSKEAQALDIMVDDGFQNLGSMRTVGTAGAGVPFVAGTGILYQVSRKM
jgi:prepilin-type N-terminal cleavage/methylation domain-containing protein